MEPRRVFPPRARAFGGVDGRVPQQPAATWKRGCARSGGGT